MSTIDQVADGSDCGPGVDACAVFQPRRSRAILVCVIGFGLGAVYGLMAAQAGIANAQRLRFALYAAVLLGIGFVRLAILLRGAPLMTVGPAGVALRTVFRTRTTPWSDLMPFVVVTTGFLWRKRTRLAATFRAGGRFPGVAPGRFVIPDAFHASPTEIMAALAVRQAPADMAIQALRPGDVSGVAVGVPGFRWPWLTTGLLGVMLGVFALEQTLAVDVTTALFTPARATLVALGASSLDLVEAGQGWRMVTAPFLHASLLHFLGNAITLGLAGYALERYAGRLWTLGIFVVAGLAGSFGSLAFNGANIITVGASGAIMGMLAAIFVMSFHLPAGRPKAWMQGYALRVCIPALIPLQWSATVRIDYGAHGGGAAMGALMGLAMLVTWRPSSPLPSLRGVPAVLGAAGLLAAALGTVAVARGYPAYAALGPLIPPGVYPKTDAELAAAGPHLLVSYPHDPRSSFLAAIAQLRRGDAAGAEQSLHTAIAMAEAQSWRFRPNLPNVFRVVLSSTLLAEGRKGEAQAMAEGLCRISGPAAVDPAQKTGLVKAGLCGTPS